MAEKKKELERRFYTFETKAEKRENGLARLSGSPIVFNSPTDIGGFFREIILPGSLKDNALRDVPLIVNHNDRMIPVARSRRNNQNSTMRLMVTERGLDFEADIDIIRNATALELYSAVERSDIDGMSFAFLISGERWEDMETDYPTRYITEFDLIREISAVTFPAYSATKIDARSKEVLDNARSAMEIARRQKAEELDSGLELAKARYLYISNNI